MVAPQHDGFFVLFAGNDRDPGTRAETTQQRLVCDDIELLLGLALHILAVKCS